eukprot:scaffold227384_cov26-Cyclotella_meneghiniana.AAC.1
MNVSPIFSTHSIKSISKKTHPPRVKVDTLSLKWYHTGLFGTELPPFYRERKSDCRNKALRPNLTVGTNANAK